MIDPSVLVARDVNATADPLDYHLPLENVCKMQARAGEGFCVFIAIVVGSLSFVIFGTSAQSLSGLREACSCCCGGRKRPPRRADTLPPVTLPPPASPSPGEDSGAPPSSLAELSAKKSSVQSRYSIVVDPNNNRAIPPRDLSSHADRLKGQLALFTLFLTIICCIVVFFTFVPLYAYTAAPRNDSAWRQACDDYDVAALDAFGLS